MRMLLIRLLPLLLFIFLGQVYAHVNPPNHENQTKQVKKNKLNPTQEKLIKRKTIKERIVYGRYEWVGIVELEAISFKAKMDTGALTSSLHAEEIELFTRKSQVDGEEKNKESEEETWVRFMTRFNGELIGPYEFPLARLSRVKVRHEEKSYQGTTSQPEKSQYKTDKSSKKKTNKLISQRPVIELTLCIGDEKRAVEVNLTSRKNLLYPLLIGAKALQTFEGLVDVSEKFTHPLECGVEFKQ